MMNKNLNIRYRLSLFCIGIGIAIGNAYAAALGFADPDFDDMEIVGNQAQSTANAALILSIIALIVAVGAGILAVILFLRHNKMEENSRKTNSKLKALEQSNSSNGDLSMLKREVALIKSQIEKLNSQVEVLKYKSISQPGQNIGQRNTETSNLHKSVEPDKKHDFIQTQNHNEQRKIYVSVPANNMFTVSTPQFSPGKSLYEITTTDGVNGSIVFIDRKEALSIAKRNLTQFIESVCSVQGDVPSTINGIRTIRPGKVISSGNGWRLEEKALIEYR